MLHALYIVAFAVLAVLAISNLIRNLILLGADARQDTRRSFSGGNAGNAGRPVPHPEMLDEKGRVIEDPLLVMKSISLEDAREQLDALYENSSNPSDSASEEEV
jgi:hypothetical protein